MLLRCKILEFLYDVFTDTDLEMFCLDIPILLFPCDFNQLNWRPGAGPGVGVGVGLGPGAGAGAGFGFGVSIELLLSHAGNIAIPAPELRGLPSSSLLFRLFPLNKRPGQPITEL